MKARPTTLDLHIETLLLEGARLGDPQVIRATIEAELTRLFTERGVPGPFTESYGVDGIQGDSFAVRQQTGSADAGAAVGRQAAAAIYRGIGR